MKSTRSSAAFFRVKYEIGSEMCKYILTEIGQICENNDLLQPEGWEGMGRDRKKASFQTGSVVFFFNLAINLLVF